MQKPDRVVDEATYELLAIGVDLRLNNAELGNPAVHHFTVTLAVEFCFFTRPGEIEIGQANQFNWLRFTSGASK